MQWFLSYNSVEYIGVTGCSLERGRGRCARNCLASMPTDCFSDTVEAQRYTDSLHCRVTFGELTDFRHVEGLVSHGLFALQ